jgi:hypothetical protein
VPKYNDNNDNDNNDNDNNDNDNNDNDNNDNDNNDSRDRRKEQVGGEYTVEKDMRAKSRIG